MNTTLKLFTHSKAETDIAAYAGDVQAIADAAGVDLTIIDLEGEPIAAIHNQIHAVPTLVIEQEGAMPSYRVGTAPFDLLSRTITDRLN